MQRVRDVDEAILCRAVQLLSIVHSKKSVIKVDILDDVPQLLVYLFERITTEAIPDEMKPFGNIHERTDTLQMILDTLQETLGVSLTHLSGYGLARLDRRQLADALGIFDDLLRHCFTSSEDTEKRCGFSSDGGLTRSLLDRVGDTDTPQGPSTPDHDIPERDRHYCYHEDDTRNSPDPDETAPAGAVSSGSSLFTVKGESNQKMPEKPNSWSPLTFEALCVAEKQTGNVNGSVSMSVRSVNEPLRGDIRKIPPRESSLTVTKELRNSTSHASGGKRSAHKTNQKQRSAGTMIEQENRGSWFSPEIVKQGNVVSKNNTSLGRETQWKALGNSQCQDRFAPYRNEKSFAKDMASRPPVKVRKPSVKSFGTSITYSRKQMNNTIQRSQKPKETGREFYNDLVRAKPLSNTSTTKVLTSQKGNSTNKMSSRTSKKNTFSKSVDDHVRLKAPIIVSNNVQRETNREGTLIMSPNLTPGRKRIASVVSTKVRRCSSSLQETHERRMRRQGSVRRGQVSPQTTSLCSSIKLLEEFDYVRRRLKEIKRLKEDLLQTIKDLDEEADRLEAVLSHVHMKSQLGTWYLPTHIGL